MLPFSVTDCKKNCRKYDIFMYLRVFTSSTVHDVLSYKFFSSILEQTPDHRTMLPPTFGDGPTDLRTILLPTFGDAPATHILLDKARLPLYGKFIIFSLITGSI
ncbi:MAG: hypothetical protein D3920_07445 [Candidatus Electrothrix sp. AW2]|nr:hypothetical protein [Candidatus Electrothrix gigas]